MLAPSSNGVKPEKWEKGEHTQAVMEVGGNVLLVRAGALYHDIGKIDNALFFIENQMAGINPHDELSSDESAQVIISHVIKGIEKANSRFVRIYRKPRASPK